MTRAKKKIVLFRPTASMIYRQGEIPIQLLSIARMHLPDYDVKIVCSEVGLERLPRETVEREIEDHLEDCVYFGITSMTGHGLSEALDMCKWVRKVSPETKIVWGGWHTSLLARQVMQEPEVDFSVIGQGEDTASELAASIEAGKTDFSHIQGLGWRDGDRVVLNPSRPIVDIETFPSLPYDLVDIEMFEQNASERMVGVITSVGCPLNCGFCADRAVYGGKWKRYGPERTLNELRFLRDTYGVTTVKILDSNFFVHWPRGIEILSGMRELGMRAFWLNARIPRLLKASEGDLKLFRDTVDCFLVGAESGSEETLRLVNKLQTVDQIRMLGKRYADAGLRICFSTLVGTPCDDRSLWKREWDLTIQLIDELLSQSGFTHTAQVHVFTPYPGTPLFSKAVEMGFEAPDTIEGWSKVEMFSSVLPYLPMDLGERCEFVTTNILQLLRPDYKFYQGSNPIAGAGYGAAQALLKAVYKMRWKAKYFDHPIEMRLIKKVLGSN